MPRMKILNSVEQEAFESPPVFNCFQRKQHFDFPQTIQQAAASLRTPANRLCFLLSCGYFKATKRFFPVQTFRSRDVEYVADRAGSGSLRWNSMGTTSKPCGDTARRS